MEELKRRRDDLIEQHVFASECAKRLLEMGDEHGSGDLFVLSCDLFDEACRIGKMIFK